MVISTFSSNHRNPPWTTLNNCLMQAFTYWLLPKCKMFNNLKIPNVFNSNAKSYSSNTTIPYGCFMGFIYLFYGNFGNFYKSQTSWFKYVRFFTCPKISPLTSIPNGISGIWTTYFDGFLPLFFFF